MFGTPGKSENLQGGPQEISFLLLWKMLYLITAGESGLMVRPPMEVKLRRIDGMKKLISWNVNGLRACVGKGFLDYFKEAEADIFCIQESILA